MSEHIRAYVVELRNGEEVRFKDGMEAYRYVESLEKGSWARLFADVDREAENEYYTEQAKLICSKINVDPTKVRSHGVPTNHLPCPEASS